VGTDDPLEFSVTDTVFAGDGRSASGQKCHKIATHPNASNEPSTFFTHAQLSGPPVPRAILGWSFPIAGLRSTPNVGAVIQP